LQQAIAAIKDGDEATAERLLAQILEADPYNESALLWLFKVANTYQERLRCVKQVLAVNPNSLWARRGLKILELETSQRPDDSQQAGSSGVKSGPGNSGQAPEARPESGARAEELEAILPVRSDGRDPTAAGQAPGDREPFIQGDLTDFSTLLLQIATTAAVKVGEMLVEASKQAALGSVATEEKKSIHDLVTVYDVDHIMRQHPDSTVIGEESGTRGQGAVHWYIDPIDGTSNFAAGIPFFCVSIGAVFNNIPLAGVIFDPVRDELFSATVEGSYLNGEPIRARGSGSDLKALLLTAFPSPHSEVLKQDVELFGQLLDRFATVRRVGSAALSLAYVASGRADVAFEPQINPWDVTAGMLLVEQAGGQYLAFGNPATGGSKPAWLRPAFIAACPEFDMERSVLQTFVSGTS
jgi:myo-inositol-1(or 4)-monophosphatase